MSDAIDITNLRNRIAASRASKDYNTRLYVDVPRNQLEMLLDRLESAEALGFRRGVGAAAKVCDDHAGHFYDHARYLMQETVADVGREIRNLLREDSP